MQLDKHIIVAWCWWASLWLGAAAMPMWQHRMAHVIAISPVGPLVVIFPLAAWTGEARTILHNHDPSCITMARTILKTAGCPEKVHNHDPSCITMARTILKTAGCPEKVLAQHCGRAYPQ